MNDVATVTADGRSIEEATFAWIRTLSAAQKRDAQGYLANVAATHSSSFIRRSAMVALRDIGSPLLRPIALRVIATEADNQNLRETAIKSLGVVGTSDDLRILEELREAEIARFG